MSIITNKGDLLLKNDKVISKEYLPSLVFHLEYVIECLENGIPDTLVVEEDLILKTLTNRTVVMVCTDWEQDDIFIEPDGLGWAHQLLDILIEYFHE